MSPFDSLPVILVSAANETAATALITELIDYDVTEEYLQVKQSSDRVWRLVNKYYTVDVRVHSLTDNGQLKLDLDTIEAHIIYFTKEEAESGACAALAERRAAGGAGVWRRAHVRLLVPDVQHAPHALGAARAHLVPLRDGEPPGGAARARQALHAHTWRGLRRLDRPPRAPRPPRESSSSSSSCAGTDDEEADELRAVEHAEAFAAALGSLGPALGSRGPAPASAGLEPDPRHERAEALVAAFCRALGYDLDAC